MADLVLYDTMQRKKVPVRKPEPGRPLTLYLCGPTVYGRTHVGNARGPVVFDVLYRLLRHLHGADNVRYARNITDIDDKIMAKAVAENRGPQDVAAEFEAAYVEDMAALGCLPPDFTPRATDHVAGDQGMVAMIAALVSRGVAYEAEGHVLFEVAKFDGYGALSRRPMDEMLAGARVEVAPYKRGPGDFVLWKPSTEDQPGWDSPWGRGRPGWHIECSAMIRDVLETETIDIHGGGIDLQFPHHENERAQSCCAHDGAELARIWMHNGFIQMGETKMSKSLGNIVTTRALLEEGWQGEVIRLALLSAHYRQPLVWNDALLEQSKAQLDYWYGALLRANSRGVVPSALNLVRTSILEYDLNTVEMIAWIHADALHLNSVGEQPEQNVDAGLSLGSLLGDLKCMGLLIADPSSWFVGGADIAEVEGQLCRYRTARAAKDWAAADAIRDRLAADGIKLEVAKDGGVTWRRA